MGDVELNVRPVRLETRPEDLLETGGRLGLGSSEGGSFAGDGARGRRQLAFDVDRYVCGEGVES